ARWSVMEWQRRGKLRTSPRVMPAAPAAAACISLCPVAACLAQGPARARLTLAEFEKLHQELQQLRDGLWRTIPWHVSMPSDRCNRSGQRWPGPHGRGVGCEFRGADGERIRDRAVGDLSMSRRTGFKRLIDCLPGVRLLLHYERTCLPQDRTRGLVVTLVLIPSAIAYADLARCPPISGLYAALGGMVAFALLTSSRHVIVGPDAALAIMVGAAVGPLADGDPGKAVALSAWLALLAAGILLLAAWLRLGAAADFLSSPVMLGFMNGAAVVIIASQLGKLCNIPLEEDNTLLRLYEWVRRFPETHWQTLGLGLAAIGILTAIRLWYARLPGTIVLFALALVAGRCFDFAASGMQVIGTIDKRVPVPVPPELSFAEVPRLFTAALGLAFLIFPEGILLGRAMADRHDYDIDPDRELVAL